MITKIIKVILPVFLAVIFGGICGKIVFSNYDKKIITNLNGQKVYLIQAGAYSNYDNMINNTLVNNYIYYQDEDGLFKSVIGITHQKDNIDKIKNTYTGDIIISEYYSKDSILNTKIEEYDTLLSNTNNKDEVKNIVMKMLELYKDNNSTLTKIVS